MINDAGPDRQNARHDHWKGRRNAEKAGAAADAGRRRIDAQVPAADAGRSGRSGDTKGDLRDWQRARAQVRKIARQRDREYGKWAEGYGAKLDRFTQTAARDTKEALKLRQDAAAGRGARSSRQRSPDCDCER
jgi:hypothetical protein